MCCNECMNLSPIRLCCMGLEEPCLSVPQSTFWSASDPGFSRLQKYDISDNAYEHYDFLAAGEIVYRSRRSINQLLTRTIRRRRGRSVDGDFVVS